MAPKTIGCVSRYRRPAMARESAVEPSALEAMTRVRIASITNAATSASTRQTLKVTGAPSK